MKELVYKSLYGENPRKCEVSIEEMDPIDPMRSKKWLCKYFVKIRYDAKDEKGLNEWIKAQKKSGCRRNCHILRKMDSETAENILICKVLGEFFVVSGLSAFKVLYVNEIRIQCMAGSHHM